VRVYRFVLRLWAIRVGPKTSSATCFSMSGAKPDKFEARSQVSTWLLAIAGSRLSRLRRRPDEELDDELLKRSRIKEMIRKSRCRRRIPVRFCGSA